MQHQEKLQAVHDALLEEMETIQKNLPADVEDISEAFERYARVVALLVRSLEALLRLNKQQQTEQDKSGGKHAAQDLLTDIEHRLAQIAENENATEVSEIPK
ncbi:MAG: hypothetical protein HAW65_05310 [Alphaproteobacteria bacterium]|nr:hypothetical protein [Alphaproteobacteria bacterium]MBE8220707.1 hypothetical protein [Alphaproteobacteria bacterium]